MPLTRTTHWATREFHTFLRERAKTPFAWGTNDCCIFAADAIKSFTGTDIADDFRGKYTDEASALALVKSVTGQTSIEGAAAYCAVKHGLTELAQPLFASRGDLVLVHDASAGLIAGVVHLNGRHVCVVGQSGLRLQSIRNIKRAWRV